MTRLAASFQPRTSPASRTEKMEVKIGVVDHIMVSTLTGAQSAETKNMLLGIPTIGSATSSTCRCCGRLIHRFLRCMNAMGTMIQQAIQKRTPDKSNGGACSTPNLAATGNDPQTSTIAI